MEVESFSNIAQPDEFALDPGKDSGRCLNFMLTDGRQTVRAFEYARCPELNMKKICFGAKVK